MRILAGSLLKLGIRAAWVKTRDAKDLGFACWTAGLIIQTAKGSGAQYASGNTAVRSARAGLEMKYEWTVVNYAVGNIVIGDAKGRGARSSAGISRPVRPGRGRLL